MQRLVEIALVVNMLVVLFREGLSEWLALGVMISQPQSRGMPTADGQASSRGKRALQVNIPIVVSQPVRRISQPPKSRGDIEVDGRIAAVKIMKGGKTGQNIHVGSTREKRTDWLLDTKPKKATEKMAEHTTNFPSVTAQCRPGKALGHPRS